MRSINRGLKHNHVYGLEPMNITSSFPYFYPFLSSGNSKQNNIVEPKSHYLEFTSIRQTQFHWSSRLRTFLRQSGAIGTPSHRNTWAFRAWGYHLRERLSTASKHSSRSWCCFASVIGSLVLHVTCGSSNGFRLGSDVFVSCININFQSKGAVTVLDFDLW